MNLVDEFIQEALLREDVKEQILDEVYFGKTKDILKIENALDEFRNAHMGEYMNPNINNDPKLLAINRMFEDQFGFGAFCIHIVNLKQVNAFTLPVDYRFDVYFTGSSLISDRGGYKFDKKADYAGIVVVYSGLMFNPHFTTQEVMAMILHEIGHNFYSAINRNGVMFVNLAKNIALVEWVLKLMQGQFDLSIFMQENSFDRALVKITQEMRKSKSISMMVVDCFAFVKSILTTIAGVGYTLANMLTFNMLQNGLNVIGMIARAVNPYTYILNPGKYKNERTADNFATMFGYGPDLSSALHKCESSGYSPSEFVNNANKIPVISTIYNLVPLPSFILMTAFDEHPTAISRTNDQLKLLQTELNSSKMDPKMKKVIQKDIVAIQKELDKTTDISGQFKDPDFYRHLYNRWLYQYSESQEFKDRLLDDKDKFYEYDSTFYDNLR